MQIAAIQPTKQLQRHEDAILSWWPPTHDQPQKLETFFCNNHNRNKIDNLNCVKEIFFFVVCFLEPFLGKRNDTLLHISGIRSLAKGHCRSMEREGGGMRLESFMGGI